MEGFPEDITTHILSRLPVKSICRFKCVSKSWNSLLCSHHFISLHLQQSRKHFFYLLHGVNYLPIPDLAEFLCEDPRSLLAEGHDPRERHVFALVQEDEVDQLIDVVTPNPPIFQFGSYGNGPRDMELDVVGCINGLVCLTIDNGSFIVIWNPSTRQFYQVPEANICDVGLAHYSYGFAEHNGHKVVRIIYKSYPDFPAAMVRAEVFDLKTRSWSEIVNPPQVVFSNRICGTIVKGSPYWPMDYDFDASEASKWILSFNACQNEFSKLERPDFGIGQEEFNWRLGTMGNALVTFVQRMNFSIDVWIKMDDQVNDCWRKRFCLGPVVGIENWVGCWKDGKFLASNASEYKLKKERKMFLYDILSREAEELPQIQPEDSSLEQIGVCGYFESLVSP